MNFYDKDIIKANNNLVKQLDLFGKYLTSISVAVENPDYRQITRFPLVGQINNAAYNESKMQKERESLFLSLENLIKIEDKLHDTAKKFSQNEST
jgi:hypothetical protein